MKAKKCDGQSVHSAAKIEAAVLEVVHRYFKNTARTMDSVWHEQVRLHQEVMRSLMGKSAFDTDMLKEMLERNRADIAEAEARLEVLEAEKDAEASRLKHLSSQYQALPSILRRMPSVSALQRKNR